MKLEAPTRLLADAPRWFEATTKAGVSLPSGNKLVYCKKDGDMVSVLRGHPYVCKITKAKAQALYTIVQPVPTDKQAEIEREFRHFLNY
jgi:hypothetical protein